MLILNFASQMKSELLMSIKLTSKANWLFTINY